MLSWLHRIFLCKYTFNWSNHSLITVHAVCKCFVWISKPFTLLHTQHINMLLVCCNITMINYWNDKRILKKNLMKMLNVRLALTNISQLESENDDTAVKADIGLRKLSWPAQTHQWVNDNPGHTHITVAIRAHYLHLKSSFFFFRWRSYFIVCPPANARLNNQK